MPRTIKVQVDTSPSDGGPSGLGVLVHDAMESHDTSGRQFLFELIQDAVRKTCGTTIESTYHQGRALFGMWDTQFVIPTESHTEANRRALHAELARIYELHQDKVQGFRLVWEGDRQQAMVDDAADAVRRFGEAKFNLGKQYFSHLTESNDDESE